MLEWFKVFHFGRELEGLVEFPKMPVGHYLENWSQVSVLLTEICFLRILRHFLAIYELICAKMSISTTIEIRFVLRNEIMHPEQDQT